MIKENRRNTTFYSIESVSKKVSIHTSRRDLTLGGEQSESMILRHSTKTKPKHTAKTKEITANISDQPECWLEPTHTSWKRHAWCSKSVEPLSQQGAAGTNRCLLCRMGCFSKMQADVAKYTSICRISETSEDKWFIPWWPVKLWIA